MSKKILKRSLALGALMAFVITGSAFADVDDTNTDWGGTLRYYQLQGTKEDISSNISTETSRVLGGWYNGNGDSANAVKTASTTETNLIVSGGKWETAAGGHYANKSEYKITSNLTSTYMEIKKESRVYQVVGGSVAANAGEVDYKTTNTNLTINGGNFGREEQRTDCPETMVIAGDLLKGTSGKNPGNLQSSIGTTKLTINGGTFNSLIIGGSAAIEYYNPIIDDTTKKIEATVGTANTTINGGTFNRPIIAGGFAWGDSGQATTTKVATVREAYLTISGSSADQTTDLKINSDIYSGGVYGNYGGDNSKLNAEVDVAYVTIDNTDVKNIYGYAVEWSVVNGSSDVNCQKLEGESVPTHLTLTNVSAETVEIPDGTVTLKAEKDGDMTTISGLKVNSSDQVSLVGTKELHEALTGDAKQKANEFVGMFNVLSDTDLSGIDTTLEESKVDGQIDIDVVHDKTTGNFTVKDVDEKVNISNEGIVNMANIGLISWRAETNDMNKRLGELRNANGEHGVWVRMVRGEDEYGNVKHQYNQYQLGYDEKLSTDKRWTVGAAINYTDAETSFSRGNGESTNKALSIYGSKLNADGTFVDLIAKYARLENDFKATGGMREADYGTNAYSFSAEAGKRIEQGNGLWIEPQVELTYGKVANANYVSENKVRFVQDSIDSLVGRIGFSLGKDIKQGNVYARASYLYDFEGDTKINVTDTQTGKTKEFKDDLGGGWFEVGVGANINLSKATYIYADVEKTFGGDVDTNWQWNLGVRYSF